MTYRYWTSDLRTGQILADWLPLRVSSFARTLGAAADLTATLDLRPSPVQNAANLAALEPRRTVLWVSQDGFPVWGGIVWDWPHTSALDCTLPIRASTLESLFDHREIRADLAFTDADAFDIARTLVAGATAGTGREVAGLLLPEGTAGRTRTVTYLGTDAKKALKALQDLAADADIEFTFDPTAAGDGAAVVLRLGAPQLGTMADVGLVLGLPGNVVDYAWPRTGSASVNSLAATASAAAADGTQAVWRSVATDAEDVALGFPVLEDTVTYSGALVGGQAQLDTYAATLLAERRHTAAAPSVKVGGANAPLLRELALGSYAWLTVSSPLHPADPATGAPGLARLVRIVGWTATPPADGQEESIDLHLGEVEE